MSRMPARALAAARPLILGLTVINLGYAAIIISLLCASFFVEGWPWKPLGFDLATMSPQAPLGLRAIMVIGIVCAAIVHTICCRGSCIGSCGACWRSSTRCAAAMPSLPRMRSD